MSRGEVPDDLIEHQPVAEECPLTVTFDGLLEGTVRDQQRFELALDGLRECGPPSFDLSREGNRRSLLVGDEQHPGEIFTRAHWQRLVGQITEVVASFDAEHEIGSTLRCTECLPRQLRETLFLCDDAQLRIVARTRPRPADDALADADEAPLPHRRLQALLTLALLLLAAVLLLWRNGTLFRLGSAVAEPLKLESGGSSDLVAATVSESWGTYQVVLHRGQGYPATPQALAKRLDAARTLEDRAMTTMIANGADLYLVLEDGDLRPLSTTTISLRPLLAADDGQAVAAIPGDVRARHLRLALVAPTGGQ